MFLAELGSLQLVLMSCRAEFGPSQPLKDARISCCSPHMRIQTAVFTETLTALGAEVRCCSCDILPTSKEDRWRCTERALDWGPDLIVDEDGDAALLIHEGVKAEEEFERTGKLPEPSSSSDYMMAMIGDGLRSDPRKYRKMTERLVGVSTGVRRANLPCTAIYITHPSPQFENLCGCRRSLVDGLTRATDVIIAGKLSLVCGYGDVGKGCAEALKRAGAGVIVAEIDPIRALEALTEGFQVLPLEDVVSDVDIFVTATGNEGIITVDHMRKMKNNAIVCSMGQFDNEIDMLGLETCPGVRRITIKPHETHRWVFPETDAGIIVLAEGRLMNMSTSWSFTSHVIAQLELWKNGKYDKEVYGMPKHLDQKVAALHLEMFGGKLTKDPDHKPRYCRSTFDYCNDLKRELEASNVDREGMIHRLEATNGEKEVLQRQLDASNTDKEGLIRRLEATNGEKEVLQRQLDASNGTIIELERQLETSKDDREELNRRLMCMASPRGEDTNITNPNPIAVIAIPEQTAEPLHEDRIIDEIIKSVVYSGMDESINGLRLVSSVHAGGGSAWKMLNYALAFMSGKAVSLIPELWDLRRDRDEYRKLFGGTKRMWLLHLPVAFLSVFLFGLLAPAIYRWSFPGHQEYYKILVAIPASLISIIVLAAADAYTQPTPKPYKKNILRNLIQACILFLISYFQSRTFK